MDSQEEIRQREEGWNAEELGALRAKYGLDAAEVPDRWKPWEWSWHLARRIDQLSDQLVAFVNSGFEQIAEGLEDALDDLGEKCLVSNLRPNFNELRAGLREALSSLDGEISTTSETEESTDRFADSDLPCQEFLENLTRRKLGLKARDWDMRRLIEIAKLRLTVRSESGRAYLNQAISRYVANAADAMIAIPCRAVMEAELKYRIDEKDVLRAGNSRDPRRVGLLDYLKHARRTGVLPRKADRTAFDVKEAGDVAAHALPNLRDPSKSFDELKIVLDGLEESDKKRG